MIDYFNSMGFLGHLLCLCLVLSAMGLTGSCTAVRVEPRQDLFNHLEKDGENAGPGDEAVFFTWQQSFPCSRLLADLSSLNARNYTMAAVRGKVAQAAMAYGLTAASLGPSPVSVGAKFENERETCDDGQVTHTDTFTLSAGFEWEADIWGRLGAKKKAAELLQEEQEALARQTLLELQTRLVMCWIDHQTALLFEKLVATQQEKNRQLLELTRIKAGLGFGTRLDVLQQSQRLAQLNQSVTTISMDRQTSANAYDILLGRPPSGANLPVEDLPWLEPFSSLPGPRQLLSLRPDLKAAFAGLRAADQEVASAIADRLPRIAFGCSFALSGKSLTSIGNDSALSLFTNLLIPIFDAGRKAMAVKQRKAQAQTALAVLHQTMLDALLEVENAVVRERSLFSKLTLLDRELAIAGQTSGEARLMYVNGEEMFLSVLLADISQDRLEQERVRCKKALLINRARLLRALGVTDQPVRPCSS